MKRGIYVGLSAVAFLAALWLFVPTVRTSAAGMHGARSRVGETLPIATLKGNELVVVAYRSVGCFHYRERLYQVAGGNARQFLAAKLWQGQVEEGEVVPGERVIGTKKLSRDEEIGLDSYLLFLRRDYDGACTTEDEIVVGYYRDGRKIGEERFQDATCAMMFFSLERDRVVAQEDRCPPGFPKEVYLEIVPPWFIEKRLEKRSRTRRQSQRRELSRRVRPNELRNEEPESSSE
jgi:hypothetical protein